MESFTYSQFVLLAAKIRNHREQVTLDDAERAVTLAERSIADLKAEIERLKTEVENWREDETVLHIPSRYLAEATAERDGQLLRTTDTHQEYRWHDGQGWLPYTR